VTRKSRRELERAIEELEEDAAEVSLLDLYDRMNTEDG
jgi:hypothetical protein